MLRIAVAGFVAVLAIGTPLRSGGIVQAAPAASPACATGYGTAGAGAATQAASAGGNGCVVIEYVVSGVTYFESFNYTGASQSWVVPAGVQTAKFMTYGAGGGGTNTGPVRTNGLDNYRNAVTPADSVSWYSGNPNEGPGPVARDGGAGGSATGTFVVTPGETLSVTVGQAGIGNSDDRCLPVVTRIGPADERGDSAGLDETRGLPIPINLWPINGVPANTDLNARHGFGGGGRASSFSNTRAFFPVTMTNDYGRDHDECINPYFAAGGGRSEVTRGTTRLVAAGGGGGAGFFGAGGTGATLASANASATGGNGEGPPFITNYPEPNTSVSPTYGSGGTGSSGGPGGLTATVLDNYTGYKTPETGGYAPYHMTRVDGVAGSAGNGGQATDGGGGGGGGCFGGGGGGDGGGGGGGSSCLIASSVLNFTTTSADGTYVAGDSINITANLTKPIADGAQITVTLDTGETVLLTKTGPYTMSGTYVVGASATTGDLRVSSFILTTPPVDVDGITMTSRTVPSGANNIAGSHAIVIGQAAAPASFTVTEISEKQGSTAGGNTVTITGTGFVAGATVTIGGKACTNVVVVSATSITCVVPAGVAGVVDVVVLNGDNQTQTLAGAYTYVAPAVTTSAAVSPSANSGSTSSAAAITSTPKSLPATGAAGTWVLLFSVMLMGLGVALRVTRVRRIS